MSAIQRILDHYDGVLSGEPWHGDAVWPVLDSISAQEAAARPIPSAHTIWEIVMHMTFWENVAAQRLAGLRAGLVEELTFRPCPPQPKRIGARHSTNSATPIASFARRWLSLTPASWTN